MNLVIYIYKVYFKIVLVRYMQDSIYIHIYIYVILLATRNKYAYNTNS